MESENSVARHSFFRSKRFWGGVIALVAILSLAIVGLTVYSPKTIIGSGTALTVPAYSHVQYGFTRPSNGAGGTYGEFSSDHAVTLYLMDPTQFNQFNSTGNATSYIYSSGQSHADHCQRKVSICVHQTTGTISCCILQFWSYNNYGNSYDNIQR